MSTTKSELSFEGSESTLESLLPQFDDSDLTTDNIDLSEIGADLKRFQEHELVKSALSQGVDLRQYAREIEKSLRNVENESIQDYVREADALADLHNKIQTCDEILKKMEDMLSKFQTDLGEISSHIKNLQDESLSMNIKLRNRKAVEQPLVKFVEQIAVPPDLITNVYESEVNSSYLEYVTTLNAHLVFLNSEEASNSLAKRDVETVLENLKMKAIAKIREYLLSKIAQIRKPKTNIQVLQQTAFLKNRYFFVFLQDHASVVAQEVQSYYIETISKVYTTLFKSYFVTLKKSLDEVATKDDLVGTSEDASKNIFTTKHTTRRSQSPFILGNRSASLENVSHHSIVPHAVQENQKYPLEEILRSAVNLLMETASVEYHFIDRFFGNRNIFTSAFSRSIDLFMATILDLINSSYDCIAMMIIAQITHEQQEIMARRRLECLDLFFEKVSVMVWTRFRKILEMNVNSVRAFARDAPKLRDASPHYVTRRFSDFSSALLWLYQEERKIFGENGVSVETSSVLVQMEVLRAELETLLQTLSSKSWPQDKKMMAIFMINNLHLVLSVYHDKGVTIESYVLSVQEQKKKFVNFFVEDQLQTHFGSLVDFVKKVEPKVIESTFEENRKQIDESKLESLVMEFQRSWASGIEKINSNVRKFFPDLNNGTEILQQVLVLLVSYYNTRLQEIIKRCYKTAPFAKHIVPVDNMMEEIKKYSQAFS